MTNREREIHKRIREAEREWAKEQYDEQEDGPFRGDDWEQANE